MTVDKNADAHTILPDANLPFESGVPSVTEYPRVYTNPSPIFFYKLVEE